MSEQVQPGQLIARTRRTRFRTVGEDTFILNQENGSLHYTGSVGTYIWHLCDGTRTAQGIAHAVAAKFNADPATVDGDVVEFLGELSRQALVMRDGLAAPTPLPPLTNPDVRKQSTRVFGLAQAKRIPLTAFLMLTHACNLSCYYCYDAGHASRVMGLARWREILDQLAEAGTLYLRLTGGEPTIHPDLVHIAEYAVQRGFHPAIITNGTLITPELADRLGDLELDSVSMTFQAGSAERHDRLAGKAGAFARTCRSIELLLARGVNVSLSMVVSRRNFDQVDSFLDLLRGWGLATTNSLTISMVARSNGSTDTWDERLPDDLIKSLMQRGLFRPAPIICNAATAKCVITPDGHVMPCHLFWAIAGDLQQNTFAEIWSHSPLLQQMREEQWFAAPEECQACPARDRYCFRCPAEAYFAQGSFKRKCEWDCHVVNLYEETLRAAAVPGETGARVS